MKAATEWHRLSFMLYLLIVGGLVYKQILHPEALLGLGAFFVPQPHKPVQP